MSDPHEANVQLLLHFDGAEGGDVFLDSSPVGRTVYRTGSGIYTTEARSRFGSASLAVTGWQNGLVVPSAPQVGSGDFTLEFWLWAASNPGGDLYIWGKNSNQGNYFGYESSFYIRDLFGTKRISFYAGEPANSHVLTTDAIPLSTWLHVALVRNGNTISIYIDGFVADTYTNANATLIDLAHPFGAIIGENIWIDELRFTVGVARYTGTSYTVPTAPFTDPAPLVPGQVGAWAPDTRFGTPLGNPFSWLANGSTLSEGWVNHPSFKPINSWVDQLVVYYPTFGGSRFQSPDIAFPEDATTIPIVVSKTAVEAAQFDVYLVPASNPAFDLTGATLLWSAAVSANDTNVSFDLPVQPGVWRFDISTYLPSPGGYVYINHLGLPMEFIAQGFNAAQFGTPIETGLRVLGFSAAQFGIPAAGGLATLGQVAQFGTPTSFNAVGASALSPVAQFGTPVLIDFDLTAQASGFQATRVGATHYAIEFPEVIRNTITAARGVRVTQFGQASTPVTQFAGASGWQASGLGRPMTTPRPMSIFGRPTMASRLAAQGFGSASVGTPRTGSVTRPDSLRPVRFGTPTAPPSYVARHVRRSARFGRPSAARSGHLTFGFSLHGRFGRPRVGTVRYVPLGFACAVFGLPVRRPAQRALHVPPNTRFGTPLMTRGM